MWQSKSIYEVIRAGLSIVFIFEVSVGCVITPVVNMLVVKRRFDDGDAAGT